MRHIFMSFAARLTFYILTLVFIIFGCIALVFMTYSKQREQQQAEQYTAALQQNEIQKIEAKLSEVETALTVDEDLVDDMAQTPDSVIKTVYNVLRNYPILKGVGVAFRPGYYPSKGEMFFEYAYRKAGNSVVFKHYGDGMREYTDRSWYKKIMAGSKGFWTEPYIDNDNKSDKLVSYVMPCVNNRREIYGVMIADVSLDDLTASLRSMRPYPNSYSFILDKKGKYLSHPEKELILATDFSVRAKLVECKELEAVGRKMVAGEQGTACTVIEGKDVLLCYAPMKRTGWSVCSVTPYKDVMANLGSTTLTILFILIIGVAMLSVSIRLLVSYMSSPIKKLAEAANYIARGKFDTELPEVSTKDDMKQLHDAFAHMQTSLKSYIAELKTTTRAKERIESELSIAHKIQMSLVPKIFSPFPDCEQLELFACLKPAKEVGGDFYDFFIRDDKLFYVIGDVSGKGIPASLVMAITRTLFRIISAGSESPTEIVAKLNDAIAKDNDTNMFVTMYAGILNLETGDMRFCNAGHNPPIIAAPGSDVYYQQVEENLPLGVIDGFDFKEQETTLPKGAAVLLYTDGITEAENDKEELYGEDRLKETLERFAGMEVHGIIKEINDSVAQYVGAAEQSDDFTLLCFRLNDKTTAGGKEEQNNYNLKEKKMSDMTLTIENNVEETAKLYPFIQQFAAASGIDEIILSSVNLAVEEALVNSVMYAYPAGKKGEIKLNAKWNGERNEVSFVLTDCGVAFDPLSVPDADTSSDVEERPIGGLGVFLVKRLMDSVDYRRDGNKNILTMTKRV